MEKFINVSNRLPVTISPTLRKSSGGLVSALESVASSASFTWIGWPGPLDDPDKQADIEALLRKDYGYLPVFLDKPTVAGFYDGFSNSSLWPLLHYLPTYMNYEQPWWDAYVEVNTRFADKVIEAAGPREIVWVHDYQLMLLPELLRRRRPDLRIGFFLHTPFPSYEVFRCHPRRRELLNGMLGSDQIGFHTFGYLRHFQSTLLRTLGMESDMTAVHHQGRTTRLAVYPIGIDAARFTQELASPQLAARVEELRRVYHGKRIVLGVERLDYTKGLARRLQAMDHFLTHSPEKHNVVFILICVPSRTAVPAYQNLRETIESQVGQINGRHATIENAPIHFIHQSVDFTELCALYSVADVCLNTPLRDGMNLVAKEYVACQEQEAGALILSEFAGAAEELFSALRVNPYDIQAVSEAITEALQLSPDERRQRIERMRERILRFDARYWATQFLTELAARPGSTPPAPDLEHPDVDLPTRLAGAERLALFLDYDGTLREIVSDPAAAQPTPDIVRLLDRLAAHPEIETFIISGRKPADLDAWVSRYPFTLVAEHGYVYRPRPRAEGAGGETPGWTLLHPRLDLSWKSQVRNVLRHYEGNTPGSWVEEKQASLVWHFRNTDPEFGMAKARQLVSELSEMTYNLPLTVRRGKMIVEVCSIYVDKGAAIRALTRSAPGQMILAAGDDQTDEHMFRVNLPNLVSIKVGPGATAAHYRLPTPHAFRETLHRLLDARDAGALPSPPLTHGAC